MVTVGDAGASPGMMAELEAALTAHELLKVRLPALERAARAALAEHLCAHNGAHLVQLIGRVAVLYRPRPEGAGRAPPGHS